MIGRLPCTSVSLWNQGLNNKVKDPERVEVSRRETVQHLHFVIGLSNFQLEGGQHFLHEHSVTASRRADPLMERSMRQRGVPTAVPDQCEYGRLTPGPDGELMPAQELVRWMSSSPRTIKRLSRRCQDDREHQHEVGGRATSAEK